MKKWTFTFILSILFFSNIFSQSHEGYLFEISARVKFYLPVNDQAVLEGSDRYIQLGISGYQKDIDELVGYINRYTVRDKEMVVRTELTGTVNGVVYHKFYLDPLYDANDFQGMLHHFKVTKFYGGTEERPLNDFSNQIYSYLKSTRK